MNQKNVLIVGDDPSMNNTLADILRARGYATQTAATVKAALGHARQDPPHVTLLDLRLENADNLQMLFGYMQSFPDTQCVVLTGHASREWAGKAVNMGAFAYLQKPYDVEYLLLLVRRASETYHIQQSLQASEERYRNLFERITLGMYLTTPDGQVLDANPTLVHMLGFPDRQSLLASHASERYVTPEDRQAWIGLMARRSAVAGFETQWIRHDGNSIWVRENAIVIRDQNNQIVAYEGFVEDISQQKAAEQSLRESEERYSTLVANLPDTVLVHREGKLIYVNEAAARVIGYDAKELVGTSIFDYLDEASKRQVRASLQRRMSGEEIEDYEVTLLTKSRTKIHVIVRVAPIIYEHEPALLVVLIDITERKNLEAQLQHAHRMEAIGQLTAGIAHDFNNLLTSINGFSELLQMELPADDPKYAMVSKILKAGKQAAELVRQLMAYSRKQMYAPRSLNLNLTLANMQDTLQETFGPGIEVKFELYPDLWQVRMDPSQVQQVILNLATNARDTMTDGGRFTVKSSNIALKGEGTRKHKDPEKGDYVLLKLCDTGAGFSPDVKDRIFEPFYYVSPAVADGVGLRLAAVYGIVRQNQGYIWVESEEGKGAEFYIYLPRDTE